MQKILRIINQLWKITKNKLFLKGLFYIEINDVIFLDFNLNYLGNIFYIKTQNDFS